MPTENEHYAKLLADLKKELGTENNDIAAFIAQQKAKEVEETRAKAREEEEKRINARVEDLVSKATGSHKEDLEAAQALIAKMSKAAKESDDKFNEQIKANTDELSELKEALRQINTARSGRSPLDNALDTSFIGDQKKFEETACELVLLSKVLSKGVFETAIGAAHSKALNLSTSEAVSSEAYETIFNTNILRDIQKELVLGSMFKELPMTAANITIPIQGGPAEAKWVDASTYGKPETTGEWHKDQLKEITFRTFKLAAKAYITDETTEDAIIALLPIIRDRIVESHVVSVEKAFMNGDGSNKPEGLLTLAKKDNNVVTTEATVDGKVRVTAASISALRRKLKSKGLTINKLALVVSLDAYYDLMEDEEWKDVSQVEAANAVKLQGQVGRIYGMPVVVSEYFPDKAAGSEFCFIVYMPDFIVPRQRTLNIEDERIKEAQRHNIYVTQRLNLQRYFETNNVVAGAYAK